jgi:hypothetical protein
MLILAITWLLPLIAIGFLAGVMFRLRAQLVVALALAAGCLFHFFKNKYASGAIPPLYFVLSIPAFLGAYGGGAVFGRFVQSEIKGRPVMLTVSILTVALFLVATTTSDVYR